jgi:hypothetical protein
MTVRCDGEEWALDFVQELRMIDATLKMAGVDTARVNSSRCRTARVEPIINKMATEDLQRSTNAN